MAAALFRRETFCWDLLLRGREAGFQAGSLRVRCAVPGEERPSLVGCEAASRQRPAVQVRLELRLRVFLGCLRHVPALPQSGRWRGSVPYELRPTINGSRRWVTCSPSQWSSAAAVSSATPSLKLSAYGNGDVRSSAAASSSPSPAGRGSASGWTRRTRGGGTVCPGSSAVFCSSFSRRLPGVSPTAHTPR